MEADTFPGLAPIVITTQLLEAMAGEIRAAVGAETNPYSISYTSHSDN